MVARANVQGEFALRRMMLAIYREIGKELLDVPLTGGGSDGGIDQHAVRTLVADHHVNTLQRPQVGAGEPATGLEHPEGLAKNLVLVGRQVDHAVRDHHVYRARGQRDLLDHAFQEVHVADVRVGGVSTCQREHLVGHVEPVGLAGRTDPPSREEDVDAASGSQVEDDVAGVELREHRRVAAAQ